MLIHLKSDVFTAVTVIDAKTPYFVSRGEQIIGGNPKTITSLNIPGI